MKLSDFVVKDAIIPELKATTRDQALRELVTALAAAKAFPEKDADTIYKALLEREKRATNAFGYGVAVPHAKHGGLKKVVCAIGRSPAGIDFAALDGGLVHIVTLLVSPAENPDRHLQAMERVWAALQDERIRKFLRQSATKAEILDVIAEADQASAAR